MLEALAHFKTLQFKVESSGGQRSDLPNSLRYKIPTACTRYSGPVEVTKSSPVNGPQLELPSNLARGRLPVPGHRLAVAATTAACAPIRLPAPLLGSKPS